MKVAVLKGGRSLERAVSLRSGARVEDALGQLGHEVVPIDADEALAEHFPREATWTRPQGGLFIWARLPDYIDTTDLLARALREHVAFVPGRAAYLDGRGGSEMRLNFSGISDADIREGVRRIGKIVREQVALYGTLTGAEPARPAPAAREPAGAEARVLPLRRRAG